MVFLKLFHLFFLFVWLGSLLFLTRVGATFEKQSLRKLYFSTNLPAMCLAIILGIAFFVVKGASFKGGWLHMKLTMVPFLILIDILTAKAITSDKSRSNKYFTVLHILTLILLFLILFSVYFLKVIKSS